LVRSPGRGHRRKSLASEAASDYVIRVAREKAQSVASGITGTGAIVLAADTTVVTNSRIMGKPRNGEDAANMLAALSGTVHEVLTGVVVRVDTLEQVELVTTRVHFLPLTPAVIAWYVSTGEPSGKAGAYAIQEHGELIVEKTEGSISNVVGLPIERLKSELRQFVIE
jgi:septum formation protein